jgi:prepilin-type N-terminal cleavage/methylation domain-containing protein
MSLQSRKSCQAGLTLVEVLTAASLLGILSVIGASNFRAQIPAFRTRGAALMIAGDISQARLASVKEGRRYFYVPDTGTTYRIDRLDALGNVENVKTVDIAAEFQGVSFATTASDDPYGGGGAPPPVPGVQMVFHSNGIVQNASGVYVQATMGASDHSEHAVTVTAAGRVRVWRYDGADWS